MTVKRITILLAVAFIAAMAMVGAVLWHNEGLQEGRQEGYTNAYRETVATLLEDKFGIIRPNVLEALEKVDRIENLKALVRKAPKVETQDEFLDLVKIAIGE